MSDFDWKDSYSVGDELFDGHHRQLIRYIQLLDDPTQREDRQFMLALADGLLAYTRYHFSAEEASMREAGYPELDRHLAEHAAFVERATHFRDELVGNSASLGDEILDYLKDWLVKHIKTADRDYARFRGKFVRDD